MMYDGRYNYLKTLIKVPIVICHKGNLSRKHVKLSVGFLYVYKGLTFPQARRVLEERPARNMAAMKIRNKVVTSNITVSNTERTRYRNTFPSHSIYLMAAC